MQRTLTTVVVLALIVGGIWYFESRKADTGGPGGGDTAITVSGMTPADKQKMYEVAHEVSSPDAFLNTSGVSVMEEVNRGNVVLVDFWTYSCINCQRTLPYLRAWHEMYAGQGLTIIGVHTPEFEFEKELANVARAVEQFGIPYPVVLDNDYSTWRSYNNRYWPRKYLIDIDGFIVYDHIGEGGYEATEAKIVELLEERAARLGEDAEIAMGAVPENVDEVDFSQVLTPEIYFGHDRLEHIANLPSGDCFDTSCTFVLPDTLSENQFALGGEWRIAEEQAVLESETGTIQLHFSASKVNIVAEGTDGLVNVQVLLDGKAVGERVGSDVVDGTVTIEGAGLYNLINLRGNYGEHILELRVQDPGLSVFTFTFG